MKTIRFFFALALMAISQFIGAQDTLHLYAANQPILGKVISIGDQVIEYRKPSLPDGPSFNIQRCSVKVVGLASGHREVIPPCAFNGVSEAQPIFMAQPMITYMNRQLDDYPAPAPIRMITATSGADIILWGGMLPSIRYTHGDKMITPRRLRDVMQRDNAEASKVYERARQLNNQSIWLSVMAGLGGAAASVGFAMMDTDDDRRISPEQQEKATLAAGIGTTAFVIAFPAMCVKAWKSGRENTKAIQIYNDGLMNGTTRLPEPKTSSAPSLELGTGGNGVGLVLKF